MKNEGGDLWCMDDGLWCTGGGGVSGCGWYLKNLHAKIHSFTFMHWCS